LVRNGDKILLIQHSYAGQHWNLPGGGIKKGESLQDAAKREVLEETGVKVGDLKQIDQFLRTREYKRDLITIFEGQAESKNIRIDEFEILDAGWFLPDYFPDELAGVAKRILIKK